MECAISKRWRDSEGLSQRILLPNPCRGHHACNTETQWPLVDSKASRFEDEQSIINQLHSKSFEREDGCVLVFLSHVWNQGPWRHKSGVGKPSRTQRMISSHVSGFKVCEKELERQTTYPQGRSRSQMCGKTQGTCISHKRTRWRKVGQAWGDGRDEGQARAEVRKKVQGITRRVEGPGVVETDEGGKPTRGMRLHIDVDMSKFINE